MKALRLAVVVCAVPLVAAAQDRPSATGRRVLLGLRDRGRLVRRSASVSGGARTRIPLRTQTRRPRDTPLRAAQVSRTARRRPTLPDPMIGRRAARMDAANAARSAASPGPVDPLLTASSWPRRSREGTCYAVRVAERAGASHEQELRDYFEGRTTDDAVLRRHKLDIHVRDQEVIRRGVVETNGYSVLYLAQRGALQMHEARTRASTTSCSWTARGTSGCAWASGSARIPIRRRPWPPPTSKALPRTRRP